MKDKKVKRSAFRKTVADKVVNFEKLVSLVEEKCAGVNQDLNDGKIVVAVTRDISEKRLTLCKQIMSGATQTGVAKELGVTSSQLKTWRLEIEAAGSMEALRRQQADAAELDRLRKENTHHTPIASRAHHIPNHRLNHLKPWKQHRTRRAEERFTLHCTQLPEPRSPGWAGKHPDHDEIAFEPIVVLMQSAIKHLTILLHGPSQRLPRRI